MALVRTWASTGSTSVVPGAPADRAEKLKDTDPYSGETLAEIVMAREGDLDEAYQFV